MNLRLPTLKSREVARVLRKSGFRAVRQKGSHMFFKHPDGRFTLVPAHGSADIDRGLLRQILKEVGISPIEFKKLL